MSARTLVLLHGFTGAPGDWRRVTDVLTDGSGDEALSVIEPAIVGHHPSVPNGIDSFDDEVARLLAVVPGDVKPILGGYSLGARLALGMAVAAPERFAGLLLVGVRPGIEPVERKDRVELDEHRADALERDGIEAFVEQWERMPLFASQRGLPTEVLDAQRHRRLAHDPRALATALRVLSPGRMPDFRPALPRLRLPVHLVTGADDDVFRRLAADMTRSLPDGRLHVIDGAGHNPILERPAALAALIREEILR